jgi:hypothetical protein
MGYMLRILLAALIVLVLPVASAKPSVPDHGAVAHAAKACTAQGAFGRRFGELQYGHIDATAGDEWAPFEMLTISAHRITSIATFQGKPGEDGFEPAHRFLKAFDKAVKEAAKFPHRQAHGDGVTFRSGDAPDAGLEFDIRQDGEHVIADCRVE